MGFCVGGLYYGGININSIMTEDHPLVKRMAMSLKTDVRFPGEAKFFSLLPPLYLFWDVTTCSLVYTDRRFGYVYCFINRPMSHVPEILTASIIRAMSYTAQ
jgi:hypothetical protein